MNDLIKFINERSERERRLILALFILLFLLILGGFANGIISNTTMASKRYQIAKSNYEYVKDSALMIINSSRSEEIADSRLSRCTSSSELAGIFSGIPALAQTALP